MKWKKILKNIGKNTLVSVIGGLIGSILSFIYSFYVWLPSNSSSIGLGVIGLIPVLFIFSIIIGFILGGVSSLIINWLRKKLASKVS